MSERLGYRPGLDGLRGVAIALVLGYHAFHWPTNGWIGVDLFFVLSGFLITALLLEEHAAQGRVSLRAFYVRRARRLLPAQIALIAVVATVLGAQGAIHPSQLAVTLGYVTNFVLGFHWPVAAVPQALGHMWSLALEEQFYLVWPFALFVVCRGRRRVGAMVSLAVLVLVTVEMLRALHSGAPEHRLLFSPDTRAVGLPVGCLAGMAYTRWPSLSQTLRLAGPAWFLVAVGIAFIGGLSGALFTGGLTAFAFCCVPGVIAAIDNRSLMAWAVRPLVPLGRVSYSVYLWHLPVLLTFGAVFASATSWRPWAGMAVTLATAGASYRWIEQPFRQRRSQRRRISVAAETRSHHIAAIVDRSHV